MNFLCLVIKWPARMVGVWWCRRVTVKCCSSDLHVMFRVESALWLSQERIYVTVGIKLVIKRRNGSIDPTVSQTLG